MTSQASTYSPGDAELSTSVKALRISNPTLGIPKLLNLVKTENPTWLVSEKRLRKVLANEETSTEAPRGHDAKPKEKNLVADTGLDETVDLSLAPKVKVKMFSGGKGKGLVAKTKIERGEMVWQEDPWIVSPDPSLYQYLLTQRMCTQCFTVFARPNPPLSVPCPKCDAAHFCNRLCLSRAADSGAHHPLLCPGMNLGAKDLMSLIASGQWRALDVVAKIWAKWRGARQTGMEGGGKDIERRVWGGMARVNMQKRQMEKREWEYVGEMETRQWKIGFALLTSLFNPPPSDANHKTLQHALNTLRPKRGKAEPLSESEMERWFSYDSFLELLGLANLNQEDSGGLYALHAHLNHNCEPNIMVRNMPKSYQPPSSESLPCDPPAPNPPGVRVTNRLTIVARKTINPGEELCVSYVNPEMDVESRRQALREGYGFWCACARCTREKKGKGVVKDKSGESSEVVRSDQVADGAHDEAVKYVEHPIQAEAAIEEKDNGLKHDEDKSDDKAFGNQPE